MSLKISRKINIPKNDVLHAILARDNNAILVTRDKHFYKLAEKIIVKKPEELI
ncbi:PIN domain-containing protein [Candidatus Woesearchaeota archaeon]|nr:PIN domain-containing protein [Candidatus Woesearchaeota archaeon]